VAPFGARGLNSAVQDVENLVWKLALVLKEKAPESLLRTYQEERWPAQLDNQKVTIRTMRFMAPGTVFDRLRKAVILWLIKRWQGAQRWVDSGKMIQPFPYHPSSLNQPDMDSSQWHAKLGPGDRIPDMILGALHEGSTTSAPLRHFLGNEFVFLFFAADAHQAIQSGQDFSRLDPPQPAKWIPVLPQPGTYPELALIDQDGDLAKLLDARPGSLFLIRPDMHLCARRRQVSADTLSHMFPALCRAGMTSLA
jgi:3-(3-hydroxy-phenyl)propionate hydroxylase